MKAGNNLSDLEYLAQLGFEKVPVNEYDVTNIQKRVEQKYFSNKKVFYALLTVFILVVVIAIVLLPNFSHKASLNKFETLIKHDVSASISEPTQEIKRDTVSVQPENFIRTRASIFPVIKNPNYSTAKQFSDSLVDLQLKQPVIAFPEEKPISEKIKFNINTNITYVHDLKVSDYKRLYFKKDQFVNFTGLGADKQGTNDASYSGSNLKQEAVYFLHAELANALLNFRKRNYDVCINTLTLISEYNKEDVNCSFYLGMSHFYKKKYSKAVNYFNQCIVSSNATFYEEAKYYKALSLLEDNKEEQGKTILRQVVAEEGFYAEKAKDMLK